MKTVDLTHEEVTLDELLSLASKSAVRIVSRDGRAFIIEDTDEFDKEVELLGKSRTLQYFLEERSTQPARTSLGDYRKSLD